MSQFDYEPPTARQPRRQGEHPARTVFYRWFPLLVILFVAALLIMNGRGL
jgi:hypothetical protein